MVLLDADAAIVGDSLDVGAINGITSVLDVLDVPAYIPDNVNPWADVTIKNLDADANEIVVDVPLVMETVRSRLVF